MSSLFVTILLGRDAPRRLIMYQYYIILKQVISEQADCLILKTLNLRPPGGHSQPTTTYCGDEHGCCTLAAY